MITLGIETSCDETALALIETRESAGTLEYRVINSLVHSQADLHSAYGGVYPNLAKREHGKNLVPLLHKLLIESNPVLDAIFPEQSGAKNQISDSEFKDVFESFNTEYSAKNPDLFQTLLGADFLKNIPKIDRMAVTEGPGLEPTLWVGINFARILGALWKIPIIPVNHMEGHILGSLLDSDTPTQSWSKLKPVNFPAVALLISGGHTELVQIDKAEANKPYKFSYKILGQTVDDAVGEAFDKVARLLGLSYPGGPHISKLSHEASEQMISSPIKLPRPMIHSKDLNFSFSGLKTAVLYAVRDNANPDGTLSEDFKRGIAHEFETAVRETLTSKLRQAVDAIGAQTIIVGGGVSANHVLRKSFEKLALEYNIPIYLPSREISGDNALMIALAGALDQKQYSKELKAEGTKRLA